MPDAPGQSVKVDELQTLESSVLNAFQSFMAQLERLCNIDCGSYSPAGVNEVATFSAVFWPSSGPVSNDASTRSAGSATPSWARSRAGRAADRGSSCSATWTRSSRPARSRLGRSASTTASPTAPGCAT